VNKNRKKMKSKKKSAPCQSTQRSAGVSAKMFWKISAQVHLQYEFTIAGTFQMCFFVPGQARALPCGLEALKKSHFEKLHL
jgi:hypothetical protein